MGRCWGTRPPQLQIEGPLLGEDGDSCTGRTRRKATGPHNQLSQAQPMDFCESKRHLKSLSFCRSPHCLNGRREVSAGNPTERI